jgi:hypothetical protein
VLRAALLRLAHMLVTGPIVMKILSQQRLTMADIVAQ